MGVRIVEQINDYKPLVFMDDALILYRKGSLFVYRKNEISNLITVGEVSWKDNLRPLNRLFRREPKLAVPIDDKKLLMVYQKKVIIVNFGSNEIIELITPREGFSDPLNICTTTGNWMAVWGDYGSNNEHLSVNIYGLKQDCTVDTVFTFPAGDVRHIHNIIPYPGGYYIFTGDNEPTAGIYKADVSFQNVVPVATGEQKYRAVVGFVTDEGLLYATDAVNEQNYIYMLKENGQLETVSPLNGSCIYGKQYRENYWFSTTVEPDESNRGVLSWVSRKRGAGILSDDVHLVKVSKDKKTDIVMKLRKDIYPMKLMQYGSIQFPSGKSDEIWVHPVAVRKYDGNAAHLVEE